MRNDLDTKVQLVKKIVVLMNRENDEHIKADLYRLTNRTLEKINLALIAVLEGQSKITNKIKCPDCEGTGIHMLGNDPTTEEDCKYCNGTGERYND